MIEPSNTGNRVFAGCVRSIEFFGILTVAALWFLLLSGSVWGDKFHYRRVLDASAPVMMMVAVCAASTWRRRRKDALLLLGILFAWAVWAALPRL